MPVEVQYLDYEPLGFLSWSLRQDGELIEQRAFGPNGTPNELFAFYTLDDERLRADFTYPWVIVGAIRPISAMEIGPAGFCCGDAEIVALARSPLWRDDEKRAAEMTAQRYGVPLVEFDRLAAVASEHGSAVPEDDRLPLEPTPGPGPRLRGRGQAAKGDRQPSEPDPLAEADIPKERGAAKQASSTQAPPRSPSEMTDSEPSTPSRAPPRADFASRVTGATARRSRRPLRVKPRGRRTAHSLELFALGAALVALAIGVWLLARAGWPAGSLPFLLPAAVVIAFVTGPRLQVAVAVAMAGLLTAVLYLLVAAGSVETPEEARVRFAMLVVAWFVTATAFACAAAAASSAADRSRREHVAALVALVLPVCALLAIGLLQLPAGLGALLVAVVELACLLIWRQAIEGGATQRASR